jgi:predicted Zn-dependent peptidase
MMMKRIGVLILSFVSVSVWAQQVEVKEATLSNGMRLLIVERHQSPTIACGWVARVGSVNERPGITGISHLFEHMMFKGTETIGVTDYVQAKAIQDRQDVIWDQMQEEFSTLRQKLRRGEIRGNVYSPENMTPRLKELRAELEQLFAEEKKYLVTSELDQIYTREGGSNLNAFTSQDQTVYIVTVPSNKLELWMWLESDRLLNPIFREFYSERDVVREERRLRVESTPTGQLDEQFSALFWQAAPYHWPIIGWASDVESITRRQAEEFFATYYAPNNLTAILVGDLDGDEAIRLAETYFGRIPRGETTPPEMITFEVKQQAEQRLVGRADTNPSVALRFQAPAFNHKDNFPLQILTDILSGRTGRLYRALVEDKQLAVGQPSAFLSESKYGGYFQVSAEVKEGVDHTQVEAALLAELEQVKSDLVQERELQKVKNQNLADSFRRLQSNFFLMIQLAIYDSNDHWTYINEAPARLQAVTAEEIRDVARQYLIDEGQSVAWYQRKEGSVPGDPVLSGLPPQMKAMVVQQLAQVEKETDVAKLQQALDQMQQAVGRVPAEMKPAFDLLARKIQERMDTLTSQKGDN